MKILLFISFILFGNGLLISQSIVFNNLYNYLSTNPTFVTSGKYAGQYIYNDDIISDVVEMNDSTFITSSYGGNPWYWSSSPVHYYLHVHRIDKFGTLLNDLIIDPVYEGVEIGHTIITDNNNVFIIGYRNDSLSDVYAKNLLIKINKNIDSYQMIDLVFVDSINNINAIELIGESVFVSNSYYNNGQFDFNLTKLDTNGNVLSTLTFDSPLLNYSMINRNFKDSLLLIVEQTDRDYYYSYFILHKLDLTTNILLESDTLYFEFGRINLARHLRVLENNDIVICGWYKDVFGSNRTKSAIVKLDFNGNVLWTKKYDLDLYSSNDDGLNAIEESSDGNLVVSGYFSDSNSFIQGKLMKIEQNTGDIIWERILHRDTTKYVNSGNSDILYKMRATKDKGYLLNGRANYVELIGDTSSIKRAADAWLLKTDSCGFTESDFPIPNFIVKNIDKYIVTLNNTSANYCTGSINYGNGDSSIFYAYSNPRPEQFTYTFGDTGTYTIKLTALAGEEFRTYENTIRIYGDTSVAINEVFFEELAVSLYPNPAQNKINIVFNKSLLQNYATIKTKVFNISGKEILANEYNTNIQKQEIDVSLLSNGVYYMSFYNVENLNLGTKKFVVLK